MQHQDQERKEENGWTPAGDTLDKEQSKTQELLRQFFMILNSMSPETLKQLVKRAKRLRVDTEERLKGVIEIIREKATSEPGRSEVYAKMCCHLIGINVQSSSEPGESVSFQKLLLHQCLTAFENNTNQQEELEAAGEEQQRRLTTELEKARAEAKKHFEGNVKFVGELFKVKLIKVTVMHEYISKLLSDSDEASLEGLCQLLRAIGKDLDMSREKALMDQHISRMDRTVQEGRTCPRICNMLQDVLNLRKDKWVPKREGPETSSQNHQDADQQNSEQVTEQQDISYRDTRVAQRSRWKKTLRRFRKSTSGGKENIKPVQNTDESEARAGVEAQNVPATRAEEAEESNEELRSAELTEQVEVVIQDEAWSQETYETAETPECSEELEDQKESPPEVTTEVDPEIQDESDNQNKTSETVESELSEESEDREVSPPEVEADSEVQDDSDHKSNSDNVEQLQLGEEVQENESGSADQTQEDSLIQDDSGDLNIDVSETVESELAEESKQMEASPPEIQDEAENHENTSESVESEQAEESDRREASPPDEIIQVEPEVQDDSDPQSNSDNVEQLELSEEFQENKNESSSADQTQEDSTIQDDSGDLNIAECSEAGEFPEELEDQKESSPEVTAEIQDETDNQNNFDTSETVESELSEESEEKEASPPEVIVQMDAEVQDDSDHQTNSDNIETSVEQSGELDLSVESEMSPEELTSQLDHMVQRKASNREICDWVEENVEEQQVSSSMFVRILMTCICRSAITHQKIYKVDIKLIYLRRRLLWKYVEGEEKELQALYALQGLMVAMKHPNYLMQMFFDELYECDVISKDVYYKWESSQDPAEQDGKDAALQSVAFFLTWLRDIVDKLDSY